MRTHWCTLAPHMQYEATTPNPRWGEAAANVKGGFSNFQLPITFAVVYQSGSDHHPPPYLGKLRPHAKFHENPTVALRDRTFYPPIVHDIKNLDTRAGPHGSHPVVQHSFVGQTAQTTQWGIRAHLRWQVHWLMKGTDDFNEISKMFCFKKFNLSNL